MTVGVEKVSIFTILRTKPGGLQHVNAEKLERKLVERLNRIFCLLILLI